MSKTPAEMLFDQVEWKEIDSADVDEWDDDLPYATHTGVLMMGDVALNCAQLSNGQRVFTVDGLLGEMLEGLADLPSEAEE